MLSHSSWLGSALNRHRWAVAGFPCHTTVHAGPHPAVRRVELPSDSQSRNPERVEVSIGQRNLKCRAVRQPPRTVSAARRLGGEIFAHSPFPQFSKSNRSPVPLLPDHRPEPVSGPLLKNLQHRRRLTLNEIADPAVIVTAQLLGHFLHVHAPRPSRHFPGFRFESDHRFRAIRGFGSRFVVKLKPRDFRSHGRATALFCWFTLSLSFVVMNRVMLAISRSLVLLPLVVHELRCLLAAPITLLAEDRLGLRPLPDYYARC